MTELQKACLEFCWGTLALIVGCVVFYTMLAWLYGADAVRWWHVPAIVCACGFWNYLDKKIASSLGRDRRKP